MRCGDAARRAHAGHLRYSAYFSAATSLPAGRYRIAYVDGSDEIDANWAWTVQGAPNFQFVLIGASTTNVLGVLPGTVATIAFGVTGYLNFDDCTAANRALPPLDSTLREVSLGFGKTTGRRATTYPAPGTRRGGSPVWSRVRDQPAGYYLRLRATSSIGTRPIITPSSTATPSRMRTIAYERWASGVLRNRIAVSR